MEAWNVAGWVLMPDGAPIDSRPPRMLDGTPAACSATVGGPGADTQERVAGKIRGPVAGTDVRVPSGCTTWNLECDRNLGRYR